MPQTQSQGLFSTPLGFPCIWVADSKSISNNPVYIFSPLFGNIWRTGRVGVQQGFSASAPLTMGQESFLIWGSAIHCAWFTSIPGLYPPDASSIPLPPFVTTKNVSRQCQMAPELKIIPGREAPVRKGTKRQVFGTVGGGRTVKEVLFLISFFL